MDDSDNNVSCYKVPVTENQWRLLYSGKTGNVSEGKSETVRCNQEINQQNVNINPIQVYPDSKVHGANMGSIWGRQDPGGSHVGPMNFAIWACMHVYVYSYKSNRFVCKLILWKDHTFIHHTASSNNKLKIAQNLVMHFQWDDIIWFVTLWYHKQRDNERCKIYIICLWRFRWQMTFFSIAAGLIRQHIPSIKWSCG